MSRRKGGREEGREEGRKEGPREMGEKPFKGLSLNTCIDTSEEKNCSLYSIVAESV